MKHQPSHPPVKLVGIECLRFLSAFAILIHHYSDFAYTENGGPIVESEQPFYSLLSLFYNYGGSGVFVFWCVSGFIFFYKYHQSISHGSTSIKRFGLNRFSRLYPLHFITLIFVLLFQFIYKSENNFFFVHTHIDLKHFVLNLLFVSHWGFQDGASFNGPIWSVSIELIVYLVFFLVAKFLSLFWSFLLVVVLCVLSIKTGFGDVVMIGVCLAYFFSGGFIALCRFNPSSVRFLSIGRFSPFEVLGISIALSLMSAILLVKYFDLYSLSEVLRLVLVCAIVYAFVIANPLAQPFGRLFTFLGNLTYSSYLLHFPLQLAIVSVISLNGKIIDYKDPKLFLFFILSTLILSAFTYRYFEMPSQHYLRSRFQG